jgi:glycogen(starch) synthase
MPKTVCMLVTNSVTNDPRVRREAFSLAKSGYQVIVIGACVADHPVTEWIDGYKIIRLQYPVLRLKKIFPWAYLFLRILYRSSHHHGGSAVSSKEKRATSPLTFSSCSLFDFLGKVLTDCMDIVGMMWFNLRLSKVAVGHRADVYHSHDLDTLLAGYIAKKWTAKKLVYDFHELYTEQFREGIRTKVWSLWYSTLERILVKKVDQMATVCESLASWMSERYGIRGILTVRNVPFYETVSQCQDRVRADRIILYHGAYFRDRGLEQLIESTRFLEGGRLILRGYGKCEEELKALVTARGLQDRVRFEPPVPMTDLIRKASEADIGVAPFLPVCLNTRFCLPNKLFEYMMAGLAIVGTDLPEMRKIILGHKLGIVIENPEDPRNIASAINELLRDSTRLEEMKRNARQAARSIYNWDTERISLLQFYDALAPLGEAA